MAGALEHSMVPLHEIISHDIALEELEPWGITSLSDFSKLPQIAIDDPALLSAALSIPYEDRQNMEPGWPAEQVVRITRRSAYSGISVAYRLAVSTSAFGRPQADGGFVEGAFEKEAEESEEEVAEMGSSLQELAEEQDKRRRGEIIMTDDELSSLQQAADAALRQEEDDLE